MQGILERYKRSCGRSQSPDKLNNSNATSSVHGGPDKVAQFTEKVKSLQSIFIGDDLERLSSGELIRLEQQIHDSLGRIRAKKEELFLEQVEEIKEKLAATRRTVNANSDVLQQIVEFASTEATGLEDAGAEGHNQYSCAVAPALDGAPPLDASLSAQWNSETLRAQRNQTAEGVPVVNKLLRMTRDLNKSPPLCED